jgi:hypothetical protein
MHSPDRRAFLATSVLPGSLGFLNQLPAVSATDAKPDPNLVRLNSGIEPLVQLLEVTPREQLLEEIGRRIKKGLAYREVLAALMLAGIRNVQPRPQVGFKFHAVLVVHPAHQAAMAGPDRDRWLPLFWALDNFKSAQAQNVKEGGWRMKPVDEAKVPPAHKARAAFVAAMTNWDEEQADVAAAGLARHLSEHEAFELFAGFGCRDFRDIGHKIIFVANAFRTLQVIGRQHAEPLYRSLAYALLRHEGTNPAKSDLPPDRPWRRTQELLHGNKAVFHAEWASGRLDPAATHDLLNILRTGTDADATSAVVKLLNDRSISPQSVWDGLHLAAAELLMRQPGIVSLHTLTTLNAFRYAFETTHDATGNRPALLLQAASFLPLFRETMKARGQLRDVAIDKLTARDDHDEFQPRDVFSELDRDQTTAARTALAILKANPQAARELIDEGRRLIFLKGMDSHDYKFSSAVFEDTQHISPEFRDRFLSASMFWLKGFSAPDSPVVKRTRAALA